jgi:hypothetical protein
MHGNFDLQALHFGEQCLENLLEIFCHRGGGGLDLLEFWCGLCDLVELCLCLA